MCLYNSLTQNEPDLGGFVIRALRKIKKLTYKDFDELGYGVNTVCNWATGRAKGSFHDIVQIVEHYDVDIAVALCLARQMQAEYKVMKKAAKKRYLYPRGNKIAA